MKKHKNFFFIVLWGVLVLLQLFVLIYLFKHYPVEEHLIALSKWFYNALASHVFYAFLASVFLPILGFPITPLFILAGSAWGMRWGLTFCLLVTGLGLTLSYLFYRYCFNHVLFRILFKEDDLREVRRYSYRASSSIRWVLFIQSMPLPYSVQNYVLATLDEVNFWHYLSISWIFQMLWAYGCVCGGDNWGKGKLGLQAIFLLLFLLFGTRYLYKRLRQNPTC